MNEMSNKALMLLLVVAIVVSLGGTFISLSKLASVKTLPLTGFVISNVSTGYVNLSVLSAVSFSVANNIDFGSGYVNGTVGDNAVLESNLSSSSETNGTGSWTWSSLKYFLLENDGTKDLNINITSDKNASNLTKAANSEFGFAMSSWENSPLAGACNGTTKTTAWTEFLMRASDVGRNQTVCSSLQYANVNDTINVSIRVVIPNNARAGAVSANITFTGEVAGN
ncbi:hypothetical protein J4209_03745 [Candidatus Woesearchaeota archaeon]|nr:hypothetical protein [Candidatus Woesearchaeota archaeon]